MIIFSNQIFSAGPEVEVILEPPVKFRIDENTPFPSKEILLAESGEWKVKQIYANQGSKFFLFNLNPVTKKEVQISENSNSIFSLLHQIKDKELQHSLAKNSLDKWIAKDGREKVQKFILDFDALTALQRDLYIAAGFKLPAKYSIYLK